MITILAGFRQFMLCMLVGLCMAVASAPARSASEVVDLDSKAVIAKLGEGLTASRTRLYSDLARMGFGAQVTELSAQTKSQLHTFSASSVLESLYRRAEAGGKTEGNRFLAILYKDAATRSAAVATDPDFASLRTSFTADALDVAKHPIKFLSIDAAAGTAARVPLPPRVEKAITKLSHEYRGPGIAHLRTAVMRTFRKPGFDSRAFERALLESPTPEEALHSMLRQGTPPPTTEVAIRNLFLNAMEKSAAFSVDAESIRIMEDLSRELAPEHRQYANAEDALGSRKAQMAEAGRAGQSGKVAKSKDADILAALSDPPHSGTGPREEGIDPTKPSGGGGGGGSPSPAEARSAQNKYDKYIDETFERRSVKPPTATPNPGGPPLTPRSFSRAKVSARAGRGVSAGAPYKSEVDQKIEKAVWLANDKDSRFGRLFLTYRHSAGGATRTVAASRPLFLDSFRAARDAVWNRYGASASYQEGEILILMSMDPNSEVNKKLEAEGRQLLSPALEKLELKDKQAYERFSTEAARESNSSQQRAMAAMRMEMLVVKGMRMLDKKSLVEMVSGIERLSAQRGIVVHPSLFGRELAWSASRVDFWSNQPAALAREARQMNGGKAAPSGLMKLPEDGLATWQYYERDAVVSIRKTTGRADDLIVQSVNGKGMPVPAGSRSHFAVSMFAEKPGVDIIKVEDDLYRRPEVEKKMQPMLDWLATNHHDYMRLNDFSEAFTLLRWLRASGVSVNVIDMVGDSARIASPDRVTLDKGPQIGVK